MKLLTLSALALMLLAGPAQASTIVLVDDGHRITSRGDIRPDDRFRVGSVSKTFVATTILQLEAEGRLSLDDPVDRYVPGTRPVALRRLLDHTGGFFNHAEDPRTFEGWPLKHWEPNQLARDLARAPAGRREFHDPPTRTTCCSGSSSSR